MSWDGSALRYPALLDPSWSLAGSMSEPRERFASLRLADGRVLVAGGVGSATGEPSASAELYDPATQTWSVTGSLSAARSDFTLSALASGEVALAVGGDGINGALDAVELYDAQSGVWTAGPEGDMLVPVGKAYFGFTDAELEVLDRFVRNNTVERFGPVRAVRAEPDFGFVVEVAFEGINRSTRHKSGVAMRFPRIARLRDDKQPRDADRLETLMAMVEAKEAG